MYPKSWQKVWALAEVEIALVAQLWPLRICVPWKVIIPLENSVGDHIWVIQIHMGEE